MGKNNILGDTLDQGSSSAIIYLPLLWSVKNLLLSTGLKEFTSAELKTSEWREFVHSYFFQFFGLISYPNSSGYFHRTPCVGFTDSFLIKHHSFDFPMKFTSLLPTINKLSRHAEQEPI